MSNIPTCKACLEQGHRVIICPNELLRDAYFETQLSKNTEVAVVRIPIEYKYYAATFWTRCTGDWKNTRYYSTKPLEYAGLYLRHKQQGYGDGADHWAIFLKDGIEYEIEYDYEGTRAFYEVEPGK